jgi:hypothetical protein
MQRWLEAELYVKPEKCEFHMETMVTEFTMAPTL